MGNANSHEITETVVVEPGALGIVIDKNGKVQKVTRNAQQSIIDAGITKNEWKIIQVGRFRFSRKNLNDKANGSKNYKLKLIYTEIPKQEKKSQKRRNNLTNCPKNHTLHTWNVSSAPNSTWWCSNCDRKVKKGAILHGCKRCNFDLCNNCYDNPQIQQMETYFQNVLNEKPKYNEYNQRNIINKNFQSQIRAQMCKHQKLYSELYENNKIVTKLEDVVQENIIVERNAKDMLDYIQNILGVLQIKEAKNRIMTIEIENDIRETINTWNKFENYDRRCENWHPRRPQISINKYKRGPCARFSNDNNYLNYV